MRGTLVRLGVALYVVVIGALVAVSVPDRFAEPEPVVGKGKLPQALARKMAALAKFAPASATEARDDPESLCFVSRAMSSCRRTECSPMRAM